MRRFESCRTRMFFCRGSHLQARPSGCCSQVEDTPPAHHCKYSAKSGRPDFSQPGINPFFCASVSPSRNRQALAAFPPRCLVLLPSPTVSTASSQCWRRSIVALRTELVKCISHHLYSFFVLPEGSVAPWGPACRRLCYSQLYV